MKTFFMLLVFTALVMGKNTALFASVKGVAKNDTLNVRAEANYNAKKVGEIATGFKIGVKRCERARTATWCEIYPLSQIWSEHFSGEDKGWVNACYLKFYNRGYVLVDGKGNCDYAIGCKDDKCELVIDVEQNAKAEVTALKTKSVERKRLKGESHFGAMNPNKDGYCNRGIFVDDYLKRKSGRKQ